jgi:hypothetical protein
MNTNEKQLYGANSSSDVRHYTRIQCLGVELGPVDGDIVKNFYWLSNFPWRSSSLAHCHQRYNLPVISDKISPKPL